MQSKARHRTRRHLELGMASGPRKSSVGAHPSAGTARDRKIFGGAFCEEPTFRLGDSSQVVRSLGSSERRPLDTTALPAVAARRSSPSNAPARNYLFRRRSSRELGNRQRTASGFALAGSLCLGPGRRRTGRSVCFQKVSRTCVDDGVRANDSSTAGTLPAGASTGDRQIGSRPRHESRNRRRFAASRSARCAFVSRFRTPRRFPRSETGATPIGDRAFTSLGRPTRAPQVPATGARSARAD